MIDKIKSEPVRVRLYALAALIAIYLVSKGVITQIDAEFAISALGVVLAVETARSKVTPLSA